MTIKILSTTDDEQAVRLAAGLDPESESSELAPGKADNTGTVKSKEGDDGADDGGEGDGDGKVKESKTGATGRQAQDDGSTDTGDDDDDDLSTVDVKSKDELTKIIKKRVDRLNAKHRKEIEQHQQEILRRDREAAELQARVRESQTKAEGGDPEKAGGADKATAAKSTVPELRSRPTLDNDGNGKPYKTYDDYLSDFGNWTNEAIEHAQAAARQETLTEVLQQIQSEIAQLKTEFNQENQKRTMVAEYQERIGKAKSTYPDFDTVAYSPGVQASDQMVGVIVNHELGPHFQYWLGSNPAEANRIAALPSQQQYLEIGRILGSINPNGGAKRTPGNGTTVKRSKAPDPIEPSKSAGAATTTGDRAYFENLDYRSYRTAREEGRVK